MITTITSKISALGKRACWGGRLSLKTMAIATATMLFSAQAAVAESTDNLQVSTTLPSNGVPEHLYQMHNQNPGTTGGTNWYYANKNTAPTLTEGNRALFAFYAADGRDGDYYIYDYTAGKWLSYTKASSYNDGTRGFVTLSNSKVEGAYFKMSTCQKNGDTNYQLQLYLSNGNTANQYINWYGGIGSSANVLDGSTTFGRYKDSGSQDNGSAWTLKAVNMTSAEALLVSTTEPNNGVKPEHLYTMHNQNTTSGKYYYAGTSTYPTLTAAKYAKFAFYNVDGVDGAYYIYDYSANKWLSYSQAGSYSSKKNFVTLSDTKPSTYFKVSTCIRSNNICYQMQPYTTSGVANIYINWYQGVGATGNVLDDANGTFGIYTDAGAQDGGSAWTITETDKTISDKAVNTFSYAQSGINVTLKRTLSSEYWNTFCVPFSIDASTITEKFGVDTQLRTYGSMDGATMNFVAATEIEAGKPYLIKPGTTNTSDLEFTNVNIASGEPQAMGDAYQMVGTYGTKTLSTNGTNLFLGEGDKFYKPASEAQATMNGMRAYFVVPQGANYAALVANIDGTATAIDQINGAEVVVAAPVYNLNGQRVGNSLNGLSRGVYVQNGKKYVVK